MSTQERPTIKVQEVLELLKKGYTRYSKDDLGKGSIQAHYGMKEAHVKELFMHPKLKQRKTIKPKGHAFILIDEEETTSPAPEEVIEVDPLSAEAAEPVLPITLEEAIIGTIRTIVEAEGQPISSEIVNKEELFS